MKSAPVAAALLFLVIAGCGKEDTTRELSMEREGPAISNVRTFEKIGMGDQFPDFEALALDGGVYDFDPSRAELTMVNVWATWCVPCRREIPELIRLTEEFGEHGLEIVGVSVDGPGTADKIREYSESSGVNYTIVHDPRMRLVDALRTPTIPTTALVDPSGEIVWFKIGMVHENDPSLLRVLDALRSES